MELDTRLGTGCPVASLRSVCEEKQPVQVNITRATMNDGNDWSWQDNDQIGLNITNYGESTPSSYTLTYNNNVWTSNPATIEATLPATIQAWWPVREGVSAEKFNYDSDKIEYYEVVTGLTMILIKLNIMKLLQD